MRGGWPGWVALGLSLYLSCQRRAPPSAALQYVGDRACARCHGQIAQAFARTWKAHSFLPVTPELPRIEDFSQPAVYDPHRDFFYRATWEGPFLYLYEYRLRGRDTVYLRKERLDFVIGSGHQTRSYLLWRNGFLYEAPLTWYVRARKWDLSPGYHEGRNSRFDREIEPTCLACHAQGTHPIPWTYNRYEWVGEALGCESCHGPGSAHVQHPTDTTYHWSRWPKARQMDVCSRCHLEGLTIQKRPGWKPGDTLAAFYAVFLPERPELGVAGIASHAERLLRSACYRKGGLTCATCHAPHPVEAVPSYDQRCLSCHTAGCANPTHSRTGCPTCHMPKGATSDIPHTQFTDHYIRVVGREAPQRGVSSHRLVCATSAGPDSSEVAEAYFRWYVEGEGGPQALREAEVLLERWGPKGVLGQLYLITGRPEKAVPLLESALASDSSLRLLESWAYALEQTGQLQKALQAWEAIQRRAPLHPDAQFRVALLRYQLGRAAPMAVYRVLDSLARVQPSNPQLAYNAALLAFGTSQTAAGHRHLRAALAADPDYEPARRLYQRITGKNWGTLLR